MTNIQKATSLINAQQQVAQCEQLKKNIAATKAQLESRIPALATAEAFDPELLKALELPADLQAQLTARVAAL